MRFLVATKHWLTALAVALALFAAPLAAKDKEPAKSASDKAVAEKDPAQAAEAAIRATADAFLAAFNKGDAKAVAALWTDEGTLLDDRGQTFKGRAAIEAEYAAFFRANPGAKLEVAIHSIHVAGSGVAIEDGVATVTKGSQSSAGRYTAIHAREKDAWRMVSVRESNIESPGAANARLAALDWFVGKWVHKQAETVIHVEFRWIAGKSFLQRETTAKKNGAVVAAGTQITGFDVKSGRVKSWTFDSTGGHGEGFWSKNEGGFRLDSQGVLADGTPTTSSEQYIRIAGENNVLGWRSFDRTAGGTVLADLPEVVFERVVEKTK
jgi:uncharacterized protein (TIGR02246 family)